MDQQKNFEYKNLKYHHQQQFYFDNRTGNVYSEEQIATLSQLRSLIECKGCTEKEFDDHYLFRFLRARNFQLQKATQMFLDFLEWRKQNDVQNIMTFQLEELPDIHPHYPHGFHKTDKLGRPIYIERFGMIKITQLFQVTSEERLLKYYIQQYEILLNTIFPACSRTVGRRIDSTLTIIDLKGLSMKILTKQIYNFIQITCKLLQDNFPEILGKMFIINAPMLFSGVWAIIKPWIDEKTRSKITIIGSGYKEKLTELIALENIPDFLGGISTTDLSHNIGPWNPKGEALLFPCEQGNQHHQNENNDQNEEEDDEDEERQAFDFAALRNALSGNISGPFSKAPHNPDKYELTTQGAKFQVSDTPLNTQVEVSKKRNQDDKFICGI